MLGTENLLIKTMKHETETYLKSIKSSLSSLKKETVFEEKSGAYVKEIDPRSEALAELLSPEFNDHFKAQAKRDYAPYFNQLGRSIIKLDFKEGSFSDGVELAINLKEQLADTFAGVLFLSTDGGIINPFHPLAALELASIEAVNKMNNVTSSGLPETLARISTVLVFTYKDLDAIKTFYGEDPTVIDMVEKTINNHILAHTSEACEKYIKIIKNEINLATHKCTQHYKVATLAGQNSEEDFYLVAHQVLAKGIFVPYYGTSVIRIASGKNTTGIHSSYCKSANISSHIGSSSTGSSVCCGKEDNKTIKGLRTQHHSNLSSPYESHCLSANSYYWIEASIKKSIDLYKRILFPEVQFEKRVYELSNDFAGKSELNYFMLEKLVVTELSHENN